MKEDKFYLQDASCFCLLPFFLRFGSIRFLSAAAFDSPPVFSPALLNYKGTANQTISHLVMKRIAIEH